MFLELLKERSWLTKVTNTINQHWLQQDSCKKTRSANGLANGFSPLFDLSRVADT
jgi:hypothetical protein